jgi:hypothetical protein
VVDLVELDDVAAELRALVAAEGAAE